MDDDSKLWEKFKACEKDALSRIYFENIGLLHRYGKKFTRDEELVKDMIQDLFLNLIKSRERLGATNNIRLYLLKSLKLRLLREIYRQKKTPDRQPSGDYELNIVYSYEEELIAKERLNKKEELVLSGLEKLTPKQREILFYRFTCDLEYSEICELMAINYDSARKMVFRSLKFLRAFVTDNNLILSVFLFQKHKKSSY